MTTFNRISLVLLGVFVMAHYSGFSANRADKVEKSTDKTLYLPAKIWGVPENNNFKSDTSLFSFVRMKESENLAIFWAKEYGNNPETNTEPKLHFNPDSILMESERVFNYYVNDLKFVDKGNSILDKYKCLILIIDPNEGTAFGGGEENKVGMFWAPAQRMNKMPFGALAHELGHSFQYLLSSDKAKGDTTQTEGAGSYSFVEMTSQYMLWQVYPEWMTFENYHLEAFMKQTHLAFLHEKNMYHSPYVLEYWSNKHGIAFIGKMWQKGLPGEDPVLTYKRLNGIDQKTFNDEIFDAARRFITWDMKRIEKVATKYANQHFTKLNAINEGWYRISESKCPQNYGYNAIQLKVAQANTEVQLQFKGLAGEPGFRAINADKAGWRYGFVAVKKDGRRVYGTVHTDANGRATFKVPQNSAHLWLVVSGAPTEHWSHPIDGDDTNDEQWPYQIKITGTTLDESCLE